MSSRHARSTESDDEKDNLPARRDERKLEIKAEVGTPTWIPGGKLAVTFNRLWDKRRHRFIDATASAANLDTEELFERIEEGGEISDIFIKAGERATSTGSEAIQDLLARLVAAALKDDAKVEPIAFSIDYITELEPVHIRIISSFDDRSRRQRAQREWYKKHPDKPYDDGDRSAVKVVNDDGTIDLLGLAEYANASYEIVASSLYKLREMGIVELRGGVYVPNSSTRAFSGYTPESWVPRPLGDLLCELIDEVDRESGG
jgi:hypothetical protein